MKTAFAFAALVLAATPAFPREIGTFDKTLTVTGTVDLHISTRSGHITVRPGSANTVQIHGIVSVSDSADAATDQRARQVQANPPVSQSGNSIRVDPLEDAADRQISISYEVLAPMTTQLRASSGSGPQTVEGIQGPVNVTTGSGSLHVSNVAQEVHATTGSGSIQLDDILGRVEATTGSGGIQARNLAQEVKARTGSGGVSIHLPASGGFELHARTGSGPVSVTPAIAMDNFSNDRHDVRGKIRGGGPLIEVSTGSGGVQVD